MAYCDDVRLELKNSSHSNALFNLPEHILIDVLSYLSFSEISDCRVVCTALNTLCGRHLTSGFITADRLHGQLQKVIRSQLPRKESERRSHVLSRFVDILSAMETRMSLLTMTYTKYIDTDLCCFIPGKVLDELFRLLRLLQHTDVQPPRTFDMLQTLRDLSTMAMEHFDEVVVPMFKLQLRDNSLYLSNFCSTPSHPSVSDLSLDSSSFVSGFDMSELCFNDHLNQKSTLRQMPLKWDVQRMQSQLHMHSTAIAALTRESREQKLKISHQTGIINEQAIKIAELRLHVRACEINFRHLLRQVQSFTGREVAVPCQVSWQPSPPVTSTQGELRVPESSDACSVKDYGPVFTCGRPFLSRELLTGSHRATILGAKSSPSTCKVKACISKIAYTIRAVSVEHGLPVSAVDSPATGDVGGHQGDRCDSGVADPLSVIRERLAKLCVDHVSCGRCSRDSLCPETVVGSADPAQVDSRVLLTRALNLLEHLRKFEVAGKRNSAGKEGVVFRSKTGMVSDSAKRKSRRIERPSTVWCPDEKGERVRVGGKRRRLDASC